MAVASSSSASSSSVSTTTIPTINIQHLIAVKLDRHNYLLWRTQIMPIRKGYELEGYVDGSLIYPPRLLSSDKGDGSTINPTYLHQVLLGWILSSLSESELAQVVGLSTTREVLVALEKQYASHSCARLMQLRRDFQIMRKGNLSMTDYPHHAKKLADSVASSGNPMPDSDLQQVILTDLDIAYDVIVTSLTTTIDDTSMEDFQAHLLAFEPRLQAQLQAESLSSTVNIAAKSTTRASSRSSSTSGRQQHH